MVEYCFALKRQGYLSGVRHFVLSNDSLKSHVQSRVIAVYEALTSFFAQRWNFSFERSLSYAHLILYAF
jgi:hypothetical protein